MGQRGHSSGPQLTQVGLRSYLWRGIEGLPWRMSRSLPGAQDWEYSRQNNSLWRDTEMRDIEANMFGQIESGKAKTQNRGRKGSYIHQRHYVQAHTCCLWSPDFKKLGLLRSNVLP